MEESILMQVEAIFRTFFKNPTIVLSENTTADDIAHWDSLTHIHLLGKIENHFHFSFTFMEIVAFKNVGDMIQCIENKLKSAT